jgi:hypothetical protein
MKREKETYQIRFPLKIRSGREEKRYGKSKNGSEKGCVKDRDFVTLNSLKCFICIGLWLHVTQASSL